MKKSLRMSHERPKAGIVCLPYRTRIQMGVTCISPCKGGMQTRGDLGSRRLGNNPWAAADPAAPCDKNSPHPKATNIQPFSDLLNLLIFGCRASFRSEYVTGLLMYV